MNRLRLLLNKNQPIPAPHNLIGENYKASRHKNTTASDHVLALSNRVPKKSACMPILGGARRDRPPKKHYTGIPPAVESDARDASLEGSEYSLVRQRLEDRKCRSLT